MKDGDNKWEKTLLLLPPGVLAPDKSVVGSRNSSPVVLQG
jgi:hypothetical protein